MERVVVGLIFLTAGFGVSDQTPVNCTAVTARFHAEIQIDETWNPDFENISSPAYQDQRNKLEKAVESVLNAYVCLEEVSFSSGTIIAKFCVGFVEVVGRTPTIFVHNLTSAIQSGSVGNLTVNSTSYKVAENCTPAPAQSSVVVVGQASPSVAPVVGESSISPIPVIASLTPSLNNLQPSLSPTPATAPQPSASAASPLLQNSSETSASPQLSPSAAALTPTSSSAAPIAPSSTVQAVTSTSAGSATIKVKTQIRAEIKIVAVWSNDLKNESSAAYVQQTQELKQGVEAVLKADVALTDVSFSPGSIIANFTIEVEEQVTDGAIPTNFIEKFKKAVQSGSVGNFTVNKTYIVIVEKFGAGITVTVWNIDTDQCYSSCCKDGILNLEIEETRTCSGDKEKCKSVVGKRKMLCQESDCSKIDYCSSAGVPLYSPLLGLLAAVLVFAIIG